VLKKNGLTNSPSVMRDIQLTLLTIICSSITSLLPAVRIMREASGKSDSSIYVTGICEETCKMEMNSEEYEQNISDSHTCFAGTYNIQ